MSFLYIFGPLEAIWRRFSLNLSLRGIQFPPLPSHEGGGGIVSPSLILLIKLISDLTELCKLGHNYQSIITSYIIFQVLSAGLFSNLFTTNARFGG